MKPEQRKNVRLYDTYALSESHKRDKRTNVSIPSEENVEEAKEFVDENKK